MNLFNDDLNESFEYTYNPLGIQSVHRTVSESQSKSETESSYKPTSSSSSTDSDFEENLETVKHISSRINEPNVYVEGTNTSKTGKLKKSTIYCYSNNFNNFWKWLVDNYPSIVIYKPFSKSIKSFKELKSTPIKLKEITSEIIFEYIGTNDVSRFSPVAYMTIASLKYLFFEFDKKNLFYKLSLDIKSKQVSSTSIKTFNKNRLLKPAYQSKKRSLSQPKSPPSPKRVFQQTQKVLIDDDNSEAEKKNITESSEQSLMYPPSENILVQLKYITYYQWQILESMTPTELRSARPTPLGRL